MARISLDALNALPSDEFVARLGAIFEHSPWVPEAVAPARPFGSVASLHAAMVAAVDRAGEEKQLALLRAHPMLARRGPLTAASAAEQGSQGLDRLEADEAAVFDALNATYFDRFGFPFIIAVRGQRDRVAIREALARRVRNTPDGERATALAEVAKIARFRLDDLIEDPPAGYLTVHALDTAKGEPARGLPLTLYRTEGAARLELGTWRTNEDGRCDAPILKGTAMRPGVHEVVFDVATWRGDDVGFYDLVPIRFRITDVSAHYHVPLLISPFGYTTYRGS